MKLNGESLKRIKYKIKDNQKILKAAVGLLIALAAFFFFGGNGEKIDNNVDPIEFTINKDDNELSNDLDDESEIICDISGAVNNPGVYSVLRSSRLGALIAEAGGLTEDADIDVINQARLLTDGEKIYIPTKEETEEAGISTNIISQNTVNNTVDLSGQGSSNGKININTADETELQKIPGVGPVTAEKIISYRESKGNFSSTEELKNISGIGEKTYQKMQDYVTI